MPYIIDIMTQSIWWHNTVSYRSNSSLHPIWGHALNDWHYDTIYTILVHTAATPAYTLYEDMHSIIDVIPYDTAATAAVIGTAAVIAGGVAGTGTGTVTVIALGLWSSLPPLILVSFSSMAALCVLLCVCTCVRLCVRLYVRKCVRVCVRTCAYMCTGSCIFSRNLWICVRTCIGSRACRWWQIWTPGWRHHTPTLYI